MTATVPDAERATTCADYLTTPLFTTAAKREAVYAVIPNLWGNPDADDRYPQARRVLSSMLHREVHQWLVDEVLEAYDKLQHMEFGGDLQFIYDPDEVYLGESVLVRQERQRIAEAVNDMIGATL